MGVALKSKNILIVENDEADLILLKHGVLNTWPDASISHAPSMWKAYEALRKNSFNLILLDLNLEDTLGSCSVEELRRLDQHSSVVVLSNSISNKIVKNCLKAGANHVAPKSYIGGEMFPDILEQYTK